MTFNAHNNNMYIMASLDEAFRSKIQQHDENRGPIFGGSYVMGNGDTYNRDSNMKQSSSKMKALN